jgi:hypothetical protein
MEGAFPMALPGGKEANQLAHPNTGAEVLLAFPYGSTPSDKSEMQPERAGPTKGMGEARG